MLNLGSAFSFRGYVVRRLWIGFGVVFFALCWVDGSGVGLPVLRGRSFVILTHFSPFSD